MPQARIKQKHDTTANWNNAVGFIPLQGEIIIYDDYETVEYTVEENGQTVTKTKYIPGIKIGTGNGYVQDLAFVGSELRDLIMSHINDDAIHVAIGEKVFWNNKINIDDSYESIHDELVDETLIITRN